MWRVASRSRTGNEDRGLLLTAKEVRLFPLRLQVLTPYGVLFLNPCDHDGPVIQKQLIPQRLKPTRCRADWPHM